MKKENLFKNIPEKLTDEIFNTLAEAENFKIERIVSEAHSSPEGFWYDQETTEFVLLVQGRAGLSFPESESIMMIPGDYIIIPAHQKHRVDWTDENEKTFWLTAHYQNSK